MHYWLTKEDNKNLKKFWPFVLDSYLTKVKKMRLSYGRQIHYPLHIMTQASSDTIALYIKLLLMLLNSCVEVLPGEQVIDPWNV